MQHKIKTLAEIKKISAQAKKENKTIVFTNGCFDLLHIGHITYLKEARALGDILIIGLNSDSSIKKLKGKKRPLIPEHERAQILSALEYVSYVVLFSEETPYNLIKAIIPHILVKGGDYQNQKVVGEDIVKQNGGSLHLISFIPGKSTSTLIQTIVKNYS